MGRDYCVCGCVGCDNNHTAEEINEYLKKEERQTTHCCYSGNVESQYICEDEQPRVRECIKSAERLGMNHALWHGNLWPITIDRLRVEGRSVSCCENGTYVITWD